MKLKKEINRIHFDRILQQLNETKVDLLIPLAQRLRAREQRKDPPQTWYDKKGRRWDIWDLETASNWMDCKRHPVIF